MTDEGVKVVLAGFGSVGREVFLRLLGLRGVKVASIVSSGGGVFLRSDQDYRLAVRIAGEGLRLNEHPGFTEGLDVVGAARESGAEVALIAITPRYPEGEPNKSIVQSLVGEGVSVITSDKTALAHDYHGIMSLALRRGVFVGYSASIAPGVPVPSVVEGLRGLRVSSVTAVLDWASNYVLALVERGYSYESAVSRLVAEGARKEFVEWGLAGWEAAASLAIIASALGLKTSVLEVARTPLDWISESEVRRAPERGYKVKQVAYADLERKVLKVAPETVPEGDPLAGVTGRQCAVVFGVEGGRLLIQGPYGDHKMAAKVMVGELLKYLEARGARGARP